MSFYPAGAPLSVESAQLATAALLSSLSTGGASVSVARKHLSGIAFVLKLCGFTDVTKDFVFVQALKGWKKKYNKADSCHPISFSLLKSLISSLVHICSSDYEASLFSCAFALAFFSVFRVSKLVPPSRTCAGGLRQDDIVICNRVLKIHVNHSKTDVYGRDTWLPMQAIDSACCPMTLVQQFQFNSNSISVFSDL